MAKTRQSINLPGCQTNVTFEGTKQQLAHGTHCPQQPAEPLAGS